MRVAVICVNFVEYFWQNKKYPSGVAIPSTENMHTQSRCSSWQIISVNVYCRNKKKKKTKWKRYRKDTA